MNIYLTVTEQAALDARAVAEGSTRSELVRVIVDRELNLGPDDSPTLTRLLLLPPPNLLSVPGRSAETTSTFTSAEWSSSTTTSP
jgi:hypothetical protein